MLTITEFKPRSVARREYSQEELLAAFKRVENKKNWKNPINRIVTVDGEEDERLITQAVIHFTGSVPMFEEVPHPWRDDGKKRFRVIAEGYYNAIGA